MQDYYHTVIKIKASSDEVLREVIASYLNVTSIKEYYSAKPDDDIVRVSFPDEQNQIASTKIVEISSINASPLPYLEHLFKQCNQQLEMDVRIYDDNDDPPIWLGHFLFIHDTKYSVYNQEDFEQQIEEVAQGGVDEYEIVHRFFNWDDQRAYKVNLDDEDAPTEYGDKLVFPAQYIPNDIKNELEHDPVAFKIKLEEFVQKRRAMKEEELKRVLLNTTTIQEGDLPF